MQRWIIHIDMDAFFAAVEQRDNPALQGRPVIVGGLGNRGVVSTASYEARKYGVHSALPMVQARRLCPEGVFLSGNYACYRRVSQQIRGILAEYSPLIEPLSIDEAFLDVSGMEKLFPDVVEIARIIKARIREELGLTASAGVAPNKFLAKLASDLEKPDGLVVIRPGEEAGLLYGLPVERLWGIGAATAEVLKQVGIRTIGQVACADIAVLVRCLGKAAYDLQRLARGEDNRPVIACQAPKSIGKEETFADNVVCREDMQARLLALAEKVGWRLRRSGYAARTITVKIRFGSFRTITRSRTLPEAVCLDEDIYDAALAISREVRPAEGIRLLGISVSHLQAGWSDISLFDRTGEKRLAAAQAADRLKSRFGEGILTRGTLILPRDKE